MSAHQNDRDDQQDNSSRLLYIAITISFELTTLRFASTVLLTMIMSALAVIYINTPESQEQGEQAVASSYNVYGNASQQDSTGTQMSAALLNSLVIVAVICGMTFVIVVLYKYRCMKILISYMVAATGLLLGYISSVMFRVAIDRYSLTIDKVSFWFFIYNFAVVGTLAIFFGRGIPVMVQQGYLIANSVIVAWQLSYFDSWTAWALLIMLALYDLFAVLSPWGPLRALVNLMQREDAPEMPGLLYEASLPREAVPQQDQQQSTTAGTNSNLTAPESAGDSNPIGNEPAAVGSPASTAPTVEVGDAEASSGTPKDEGTHRVAAQDPNSSVESSPSDGACNDQPRSPLIKPGELSVPHARSSSVFASASGEVELTPVTLAQPSCPHVIGDEKRHSTVSAGPVDVDDPTIRDAAPRPVTALIPLALARMYKLRLVDDPQPRWLQPSSPLPTAQTAHGDTEEDPERQAPSTASTVDNYTPEELGSLVHVVFPVNGGRIRPQEASASTAEQDHGTEPTRYDVIDRDGVVRRTLVVRDGRVFRIVPVEAGGDGCNDIDNSKRVRNTIKLGLGDFIFYSILVSEAAVYSFTTFCACALVILDGLGTTLFLLAVYGKALPALPISIFLGVTFYILTRYFIQPWIQSIFIAQAYV